MQQLAAKTHAVQSTYIQEVTIVTQKYCNMYSRGFETHDYASGCAYTHVGVVTAYVYAFSLPSAMHSLTAYSLKLRALPMEHTISTDAAKPVSAT